MDGEGGGRGGVRGGMKEEDGDGDGDGGLYTERKHATHSLSAQSMATVRTD